MKHTPRWLIFFADVVICMMAYVIAFLLRFEFHPPQIEIDLGVGFFWIFIAIRAGSFFLGKTYAGIIRYTSTQDAIRIFTVLTIGSVIFCVLNQVRYRWLEGIYYIPYSIIFIEYLVSLFALIVSRIAVKVMYMELKTPVKAKTRVVIYGAGESGLITKRTIDREKASGVQVVAFIDDDKGKAGKKIEGASIYHSAKADELLSSGKVDQIIISIQKLSPEDKRRIINMALKHDVRVMNVPPVRRWIKGELSVRQIRDIQVDDLLGRQSIRLDNFNVRKHIEGKRVLVTGAAGSIGSEIARQLSAYDPQSLVLFDQAETPTYDLNLELGHLPNVEIVLGDIRNRDRLFRLFDHAKPQVVYHAAAYKHVPLMESNPSEAVLTNVLGSKNLADLSNEYGVERFVQVSTDKAVNPTNVMGASKRVAEMYAQALNEKSQTAFITTRFGNVLGSNGSVIPLFKEQISNGGPVTVTDKEVTRYFMTIPEAVQLVLEAGAMGDGGEIFVFDMGESIKIYDLAKQMIKLSGLELGKDIEIEITGLRPGEKLYEELLTSEENTVATHHPKILRAKVQASDYQAIAAQSEELIELFDIQDNAQIVQKLKSIVPEYVSANSEFSKLDEKPADSADISEK